MKNEQKTTQKTKLLNIYGARRSKDGKRINISLCKDLEDGTRDWYCASVKGEKVRYSKEGGYFIFKAKDLSVNEEKPADNGEMPF